MADIDILVDSTQVKTAKQELAELGNSFNSAAKSASIFMQAFQKAAAQSARDTQYIREASRAYQELINTNLKITNSYSSAEASAKAMVEGLRQQEAQALKTARANQELINAQLGVGGPSATSGGASFSAMEAEINSLATRYNSVYAASQLYEKELQSLNRANQLGVISTKQYEAELERLNAEYQQYANSAEGAAIANNRFAAHVNATKSGLNNFGVVAQQVGYQVGDFFVQIQSGTSAFVAFGQQATQLAGLIPGIGGAIAGIGISVVTAFLSFREKALEAAEGTKELDEAVKSLDESLKEYFRTQELASLGITPDQQTALEALTRAQNDLADAQERLLNPSARTGGATSGALRDIAAATQEIADAEERILQVRLRMADALTTEINDLAYAHQLEMARIEFGEDSLVYKDLAIEADRRAFVERVRALDIEESMQNALIRNYDHFKAQEQELQKTTDRARELATLMEEFHGKEFQVILNVNARLPEWMGDVQNTLAALQGGYDPNNIPRPMPRPVDTVNNELFLPAETSGGGTDLTDRLQSDLDSLRQFLMDAKEAEMTSYQERQDTLQQALEQKLITIQEYNELERELTEKHNQVVAEIDAKRRFQTLQEMGTFFGAMANLAQAGGQKYIKVARVLGATEALINTFIAQSQVLRDPNLGFFGKMAAYAAIGAAGLGLVASLRSGSDSASAAGGGGGGGMPKGSATVASNTGTPGPAQTVYISGLDPNALFTGEQLANLFDSFYKENDNRGKVFVVAR
jgi:hypothetical protein